MKDQLSKEVNTGSGYALFLTLTLYRLYTFIYGLCDVILMTSQISRPFTRQYRPMLPFKESSIQSRQLKTANSCQISRTATSRRMSHMAWSSSGVLQKLSEFRRRILTRCLHGVRRKWAKNISWTQNCKEKMLAYPQHRRDMDSSLLSPSCEAI